MFLDLSKEPERELKPMASESRFHVPSSTAHNLLNTFIEPYSNTCENKLSSHFSHPS